MKNIKLSLNWIRVRSLGSLKILTKASYIALIIVPIIAALWPGVKFSINRYNVMIEQSILELNDVSTSVRNGVIQLDNTISKVDGELILEKDLTNKINLIMDDLEGKLEEIKTFLARVIIKNNNLPLVFAKSFFAALFIVLAHLLYDIYAHDIVKKYSLDEYKEKERELYAKYPSEGAIRVAEFYADMASKQVGLAYTTYSEFKNNPEDLYRKTLDFISTGAHAKYLVLSVRNFPAIIVSVSFYLLGIILLLSIVFCQSLSVIRSVGDIDWLTILFT